MTISLPQTASLHMRDLAPLVKNPASYLGGEVNAIVKDHTAVACRVALAYPDTYAIGMSHVGLSVLYSELGRAGDLLCERVFQPWMDMETLMRERGVPLETLETGTSVRDFDIFGITLPHELCFTGVVNLLDLAGLAPLAADRRRDDPIIVGGGSAAFACEPVAPFFDVIVVGDGEGLFAEIARRVGRWRPTDAPKEVLLRELSGLRGVYVPAAFEPVEASAPGLGYVRPLWPGYDQVEKSVVDDLDAAGAPEAPVLPYSEPVHDRLAIELLRGCNRGCRFCQAGYTYRPYRERTPAKVLELARRGLEKTGYEEISLLSLSSGDYSCLDSAVTALMNELAPRDVALSMPSLRVESLSRGLMDAVATVRKGAFTIAPEAGTERLRQVINKVTPAALTYRKVEEIFRGGWNGVKLYFMIGLPTETDDDVDGIVEMAAHMRAIGRRYLARARVTISTSTFVPKAHTPFQWEAQIDVPEILRRQQRLREGIRDRNIQYRRHEAGSTFIEGLLSRGDRSLHRLVLRAWELGSRFESWDECLDLDLWRRALDDTGFDAAVLLGARDLAAPLPWDHLQIGVTRSFLARERQKSLKGTEAASASEPTTGGEGSANSLRGAEGGRETPLNDDKAFTPDCRIDHCSACGLDPRDCTDKFVAPFNIVDEPLRVQRRQVGQDVGRDAQAWYRVRFRKTGPLRHLGHLELTRAILRALRRAGLPLAFSRGFRPMPRLSFGPALPAGLASLDEVFDLGLTDAWAAGDIASRLALQLPTDLGLEDVTQHATRPASIQDAQAGYAIEIEPGAAPPWDSTLLASRCASFQDEPRTLIRERRGAAPWTTDLRAHVRGLQWEGERVRLDLLRLDGRMPKPAELAVALVGWEPPEAALAWYLKRRTLWKA